MIKTKRQSIRLPKSILPLRYKLTIRPDLESFTFSGQEIIYINIKKPITSITLHAKDLDIETVEIFQKDNSQFASKINYNTKSETTTFYFKNKTRIGKAKLSIIFSGIINDSLRGFYRSRYEINGITKHIATTQFEATDARRAFPCFDEPAHKAIFDVSLIIPNEHTAISNTLPIKIAPHEAGYKIVSFSPTPKMSTYLLAFIIGDFEYIENHTKNNVKVRVFTTHGKKHQAKFALEVAIKSLEFYEEYFNIPYPLKTLDMIAIPDFESGAMENWGAITYRETAILVDENHTALPNKQWVALVIAHEIAHQWFGNLVTMHWWTDLWLNEGFASYIEYLAIDHIFPNWKIWNHFMISDHNVALSLDGLKNSHPIEVKVNHPNEINEIFDKISYSKGAAIIRMLAKYLGEETFRTGLHYYLKKHSFKNTSTINLWESLEKVSGKPVGQIMKTWTRQTGYPLISINPNIHNSDTIEIKQERFLVNRAVRKETPQNNLWTIPLEINNEKILLKQKKIEINNNFIGKINKGENAFIRVNYTIDQLNLIKNDILENKLSPIDRLAIIRDLFALAEGGYIKTSFVLEYTLIYRNETEYMVWSEISQGISKIHNLIALEKFNQKYQKYVLNLFTPLANKKGFEPKVKENHEDVFLRNLSIAKSGIYGDQKIINQAQILFKERLKKSINKDIRGSIYQIVASNGNEKEWATFEKLYKEEKMQEEKDRLARALASFKDKNLLSKTLNFALSNNVRIQDSPFMIIAVWQNVYGRDIAWSFVKNNWTNLNKKYGQGGHFINKLLSPLENHIAIKDIIDIDKFFSKNTTPGAERALEQAKEKIITNASWVKADKLDIERWLNKNF